MKLFNQQDDQGFKKRKSKTAKFFRQKKHKVERLRAKKDPEAQPLYNKYHGWNL